MNDMVINGLAVYGAVTGAIWLIRTVKARRASAESEPPQAPPLSVATPMAEAANDDIAVVAAAVYSVLGACRIVHIEETGKGQRWAAEGRWMHQTSHRPH